MDGQTNDKNFTEREVNSNPDMTYESDNKEYLESDEKSTVGPTVLFFWIWNWFATLPKTVTNLYSDIKNGELLSKFSLLDAMMQFVFAVATSCHPQEDGMSGEDEDKPDSSPTSKRKEAKPFTGSGRTLRSRTVEASS